ncbi:DNA polymerase [Yersinia phage YerA41]|nr:DNA polymerase [Yersinia phage YerA41]
MSTVLIGYVNIRPGKGGKLINQDVWKYFEKYVPAHFEDVDLLLFNPQTLPNLSDMIEDLNKYDNIIVTGREPLKYLGLEDAEIDRHSQFSNDDLADDQEEEEEVEDTDNEEDDDSEDDESGEESDGDDDDDDEFKVKKTKKSDNKIEVMRYFGLINNNPALKFNKIHVMYSLMMYIAKDKINVFHFDLLNRTGKNNLVPPMVQIDPKFHHISELESIYHSKWQPDEHKGFDFETRNFPFEPRFRLLGFSLANDTYQAYFYFSRDDDKYAQEMEQYRSVMVKIFLEDAKKLHTYNNKFENNAVLDQLRERIFFEDSRIYTQMLKTRGSLKFSANLFLGVPVWNEGINTFMKNYKEFVAWMKDYRELSMIEESVIDKNAYEITSIKDLLSSDDKSTLIKLLGLTETDKVKDRSRLEFKLTDDGDKKEPTYKLTTYVVETYFDLLLDPIKFVEKAMEHSQKYEQSFFKFFMTYQDRLEGKFKLTNLLTYFIKNYNEWQSCGIGDMGYYCILDGYYTVKLKEMLYDTNYDGCADGYIYYLYQSHFASLLEANKVHIDKSRFVDWMKWAYETRMYHAKKVALHPKVVENYSKSLYKKKFSGVIKTNIESVIKSYNGNKRVVAAELSFVIKYQGKDLEEMIKTYYEHLAVGRKALVDHINETGNAKLTKTQKGKIIGKEFTNDDKIIHKFIEIIDKKYKLAFFGTNPPIADRIAVISQFINHLYNRAEGMVNITYEDVKQEYLDRVNSSTDYYDIDRYLEFSSTRHEARLRMTNAVIPAGHEMVILQFLLVNRLKSTSIDHEFIDKMPSDEFGEYLVDLVKRGNLAEAGQGKRLSAADKIILLEVKTAKGTLSKILSGEKLGKHALRTIKQAWDFKNGRKNSLDEYPDFIQLIYHLQLLKRHNKSISTVIEGSLGGGSFIVSHKDSHIPIGPKTSWKDIENLPEDTQIFYKTTYWQNDKDTLRWSSSFHTIPSTLDYSLCFTPRKEGRMFFHMDMAQAEVRIAFAVAKEMGLINAILKGLDIHGFNANNAFDLGFAEDELYKIKQDPELDQLRSYAKMLTFAILYGASVGSIAKQIKKPFDEAKKIYDGYFNANPNFKKFVEDNIAELSENFGFRYLPIFNHRFYIGNPYHYSIKQKGLNYIIQNLSSSLTAYTAYALYDDLRTNYGVEIQLLGFVHDAIEFEFDAKDLFIILDRMNYWYKEMPLEKWDIPSDFDFELGSSRYSGGSCKVKYNDDKSMADIKLEIKDYYNDKEDILKLMKESFNIIEDSLKKEDHPVEKHPFVFMIDGVKPDCRFREEVTDQYVYSAKIGLK